MDGGDYCGCLGQGNGCTNLAGQSFSQIAASLGTEFSAHRPTFGSITGSMSNVSITFTAITAANSTITVTSPSGTLAPGMFVCLKAGLTGQCIPNGTSGTYVGQIISQVGYYCANPPCVNGGTGTYVLFVPSKPLYTSPTAMTGTYAALTIAQGTGSIETGAEIRAMNLHENSILYTCLFGCNPQGFQSPQGTWAVPYQPNAPVVNEELTVVGPSIGVTWRAHAGVTHSWGDFYLSSYGGAPPLNSRFGRPTGLVLDALGLLPTSVGDGAYVNNTSSDYAFYNASPPADFVPQTTISGFMNNFLATVSGAFGSCTLTTTGGRAGTQPPNANVLLKSWAQATPPYNCPAAWVQDPAWTPPAGEQ